LKKNTPLIPLSCGGGQQFGMRAGTENVPAIAGFGLAAEIATRNLERNIIHMRGLRDMLESKLQKLFPEIVIFGKNSPRLPNTSLISLIGTTSALQTVALDLRNIAVSSGAACSSGKISKSHVLKAMGVQNELSYGAIRISNSYRNSVSDIDCLVNEFQKINSRI
jgi:cysteine desulfurase